MRTTNKEFFVTVTNQLTKIATTQDFSYINHDKEAKTIDFQVVSYANDGEVLDRSSYQLSNENYDLIMSTSPEFSEGKPEGDFREEDLFYMFDKINQSV
ncbi:hypothetical protein [Niallia taxi]|uniref:hypothetical protein n=1 Tax=Niallia taxi TaxID=2499688 RepID=UPI0015F74553|nr:hypothetical protein [Niallia taxi]